MCMNQINNNIKKVMRKIKTKKVTVVDHIDEHIAYNVHLFVKKE